MTEYRQIYKRTGECNHCGACCSFDGVIRGASKKDWKLLKKLFGMSKRKIKRHMGKGKCPNHVNHRCVIYDTRPSFCKAFPDEPLDIKLMPECGYNFEDASDDM